jgi:aminopeptidase N
MSLIAHWATKTEEYEEALQALLDCDERLAEYAEAVAGLRDAARAATTQGAVEETDRLRRKLESVERSRSADEDRYEAEIARLRALTDSGGQEDR